MFLFSIQVQRTVFNCKNKRWASPFLEAELHVSHREQVMRWFTAGLSAHL